MLRQIKSSIFYSKIKSHPNYGKTALKMATNDCKKILVFLGRADAFADACQWSSLMEQRGSSVTIISFGKNDSGEHTFGEDDLTWYGAPACGHLESALVETYDLMLHLPQEMKLHDYYVARLSLAQLKVACSTEYSELCDLTIDLPYGLSTGEKLDIMTEHLRLLSV